MGKHQYIYYFNADFISFIEIKQLSDEVHEKFSYIDVQINNVGIYQNKKIILYNGIENNFMVNYLTSFLLTLLLLDLIKKADSARIINIS